MRNAFVATLTEIARADKRVVIISPDMGFSIFEKFSAEFPGRFINVGIAEQNAIGVAAGMAMSGKIPYVYSIVPFVTMRCFEQVRVDLACMENPVRLVGVGSGLTYGAHGPTHHAIEDIAIMRALPGMTVLSPADAIECAALLPGIHQLPGPAYLRLGRSGDPNVRNDTEDITLGSIDWLRRGKSITILATGGMVSIALRWAQAWETRGIATGVASVHTIKPLDATFVQELVVGGSAILTLEEHSIIGGLGSAIAEILAESGMSVPFRRLGIPDKYVYDIGDQRYLREKLGIENPPDPGQLFSRPQGTVPFQQEAR